MGNAAASQKRSQAVRIQIIPLLVFLALPLLTWQPLLTGHTPWHGDGLLHFYRLVELERAVRAGDWFPRWSADLGYGFGFPLFHYYAPFSYYVALIPRLLGLPLAVSLQISYALALFLLGLGTYLWARAVWQSEAAGITAVLATLYAPYILYNTYHRAALAELWGLAWLTMGFFYCRLTIDDLRLSRVPLLALSVAFLLLSHNITALLGIPLLFSYVLILNIPSPHSPITIHHSLSIIFLGLALSAFFWLPAFFERGYVQIENLTGSSNFAYTNHFLNLSELFAWPKTAVPNQINPPIPRSLPWPAIILALFAFLPGKKKEAGDWRLKISPSPISSLQSLFFLTLLTLGSLFMTLPASQFIWDAIPLLAFVQFPWRFLGMATLGLAMLAALGAQKLVHGWELMVDRQRPMPHSAFRFSHFLFLVFCLLFTVFALPWLFPGAPPPLPTAVSPQDTIRFEAETGWLGTTAAADYLPIAVQALPPFASLLPRYDAAPSGTFISRLDTATLPANFTLLDQEESYTATTISYTSQEEVTAVFDRFYFPGWRATLDNQPITLTASEPEGLITTVLPPGNHTFHLAFAATSLRTAANALSFASLLLLLFLIIRNFYSVIRKSSFVINNSQFTIHHSQFIILFLLLFFLKTFYLDHANTPFRQNPFDGQTLHGVAHPAQVNFGDNLSLIGYDLPNGPIPADQPIPLTLYWRALPPVGREISVSVQLLAANGRRYAQSDSFHPAGLPVTRWQAGEFAIDRHSLALLPAAPPGNYQLLLYAYETATGRRLDRLNEAGLPLGNDYPLGAVAIALPATFPDPASLPIAQRQTENGRSPFLGGNVQLLGFDQPIVAAEVGQILPLTLYWHTPASPAQPAAAELRLTCAEAGIVAHQPVIAPDPDWRPGQVQRADVDVWIAPLGEDGRSLSQATTCALNLVINDQPITLQTLPVTAPERQFDWPPAATPLGARLGELVTLAAFTLDEIAPAPGQAITLTLYWQPERTTSTGYAAFVQLLGPDGRPIAQEDRLPGNGRRPTTGWLPGEIIADTYTLLLPPDAPPGGYRLITGLYDSRTGERLPLAGRNGDAITLPVTIEVKTAE